MTDNNCIGGTTGWAMMAVAPTKCKVWGQLPSLPTQNTTHSLSHNTISISIVASFREAVSHHYWLSVKLLLLHLGQLQLATAVYV